MPFTETGIQGLYVFNPAVFQDSRGYFFESFNERVFKEQGLSNVFVQDNESGSSYGVVRGLHYQLPPYQQAKLIRVVEGAILDVAVDIRKNSPTFGKSFSLELSGENKKQLFIPAGFAHGFSVLTGKAVVIYKCDNYYNRESEGGIRFDDPALAIDWKIPRGKMIISEKDLGLPLFKDSLKFGV